MIKKKRNHKIFVFSLILSICLFYMTGCGRASMGTENETLVEEQQNTQESSNSIQEDPDKEETETIENEDNTEPENLETTEIDIYGLNDDSLESEPAKASIQGAVTAESIVQAVVENYKKSSIEIGISRVIEENDKVIVSFKDKMAPLENVGSGVEETILNCISDSLMDNLNTCKAVIFQGENKPYESGHYSFEIDEVYASE